MAEAVEERVDKERGRTLDSTPIIRGDDGGERGASEPSSNAINRSSRN
jgi:hypothetical protein